LDLKIGGATEEKQSRIVELLLVSTRAEELMGGDSKRDFESRLG
jgi:hypothetical protein